MSDLIMQLAGVIQRDIDSLNDVAQNIANANTPGYRAGRTFNVLGPVQANAVNPGLASIHSITALDTTGGALHVTGKVTDLALAGDGWFLLQTPDGQALTRDGRFSVDSQGQLVSHTGFPVMGDGGPLIVSGGVLEVDQAGQVQVGGSLVGQISVVKPNDSQQLIARGEGLYQSASILQPASNFTVHQGVLERSNAAMGNEMVRIMEASRHIESMQRALSAYDSMLNSGINQIGKE